MIEDRPLSIALGWTVADWNTIDFDTEAGWQRAIEIFEARIQGRFLEIIQSFERKVFSGFAVMALDCLLIETLEQFFRGIPKTPHKQGKSYFVRFLTNTAFSEHFDASMAGDFYEQFRCGILHQAEVKSSSRLRIDLPDLVQWSPDRKGLWINRRMFHKKLIEVFEDYLTRLRDPANDDLRAKLRRKMDAICGVEA